MIIWKTYFKLIKRFPNVASGYKGLGMYFSIIGDYQKALTNFRKSNDIEYNLEVETYISQIEKYIE